MRKLYNEVVDQLNKIDFEAIWPGFKPIDFVLVGEKNVYFKDKEVPIKENERWGNTCTEYEGNPLATWCVKNPDNEDPEILASCVVHEMFHGFYSKELKYDEFPLMSFPDDIDAYRIKAAELSLLYNAYVNNDRNALESFISIRKVRVKMLGDIIRNEFYVEENEGTAEYAELCALKQLSPEKYDKKFKEKHLDYILNIGENLFSVRRTAYKTGSILLLILKKFGIDVYSAINDTRPLFEIISNMEQIDNNFDKFYKTKKAKFDRVLNEEYVTVEKSGQIKGFDPMNMWRMGDQYYCARFVLVEDEIIDGPVILNLKPGSYNEVRSYVKRKV